MKNVKSLFAPLLAAAILLSPGCANTPTPPSSLATKLAPLITSVVSGGLVVAELKDPHVGPYAIALRDAITGFLTTTNLSVASLQSTLALVPLNGVDPMIAALVMDTLVNAYADFAQQLVVGGVSNNGSLSILLNAVVTGINRSIFVPPPGVFALDHARVNQRAADIEAYNTWRVKHPFVRK